jgi:hypothetical protein
MEVADSQLETCHTKENMIDQNAGIQGHICSGTKLTLKNGGLQHVEYVRRPADYLRLGLSE